MNFLQFNVILVKSLRVRFENMKYKPFNDQSQKV